MKTVLEQGFSLNNFPSENVWKLCEANLGRNQRNF